MQTPEARDAWAERFCEEFFRHRQEFYKEDMNPILREVVAGLGVTGPEAIAEVSRLAQALSKVGVCNAKQRTAKRLRPAQTRRS